MGTMTWKERGFSTGEISLGSILKRKKIKTAESKININDLIKRLAIGGWPRSVFEDDTFALKFSKDYLSAVYKNTINVDTNTLLNPKRTKAIIKSIARNISMPVKYTTIRDDTDSQIKDDEVVKKYIDSLRRNFIVELLPVWQTHLRSSKSLRIAEKIHFCDASLAVAVTTKKYTDLINDGEYLGLVFESLVYHDLKIYTEANDGELFYYRDTGGKEIDFIMDFGNKKWVPVEVKLNPFSVDKKTNKNVVDKAVSDMNNVIKDLEIEKTGKPLTKIIITGWGPCFTRKDGALVIPIGLLGE
jgi:predicted AAA+ superfamily ATPase